MFRVFFHDTFVYFFLRQFECAYALFDFTNTVSFFLKFEILEHLQGQISLQRFESFFDLRQVGGDIFVVSLDFVKAFFLVKYNLIPIAPLMQFL